MQNFFFLESKLFVPPLRRISFLESACPWVARTNVTLRNIEVLFLSRSRSNRSHQMSPVPRLIEFRPRQVSK
ncbi:hypothetical protein ANTPLA_LOCUS8393 [Anthophora plagiata]